MVTDKKYLVSGGWVFSRSDGDRHYITPGMVASLYKVSPLECLMYRDHTDLKGYTPETINRLVELKPRNDGNYNLDELTASDLTTPTQGNSEVKSDARK